MTKKYVMGKPVKKKIPYLVNENILEFSVDADDPANRDLTSFCHGFLAERTSEFRTKITDDPEDDMFGMDDNYDRDSVTPVGTSAICVAVSDMSVRKISGIARSTGMSEVNIIDGLLCGDYAIINGVFHERLHATNDWRFICHTL